ncbi:hypothetical protein MVEN_01930100 [Mycena venus]|uniref:Acyl-protein thioesterase 1 n=1 Tax=Mycena venus TaxID=2733690 RepID=A0A8H6XGJ7_9AGAR|nr:hypothetical protein MVEN_01930100 [Mycena venus]
MAPNTPTYFKIDSTRHSATVILIHGVGDSARGMYATANLFHQDPAFKHVKWILPQAPIRPITAHGNRNLRMPAWFDIFDFYNFQFQGTEDEAGMFESMASIEQLINQEIALGIDPSRIVLAGFMQGGALALLTGLTTQKKLAGLGILSGRLPMSRKIKEMAPPHASSLPIFWGYNVADPLSKFAFNRASVRFLTEEMGIPIASATGDARGIEFHSYEGLGTGIGQEELGDLGLWLKKVLPTHR